MFHMGRHIPRGAVQTWGESRGRAHSFFCMACALQVQHRQVAREVREAVHVLRLRHSAFSVQSSHVMSPLSIQHVLACVCRGSESRASVQAKRSFGEPCARPSQAMASDEAYYVKEEEEEAEEEPEGGYGVETGSAEGA